MGELGGLSLSYLFFSPVEGYLLFELCIAASI